MPMPRTLDVLCHCVVPAVDAPAAWSATPGWPSSGPAHRRGAEDGR